jgi:hypothetical protein
MFAIVLRHPLLGLRVLQDGVGDGVRGRRKGRGSCDRKSLCNLCQDAEPEITRRDGRPGSGPAAPCTIFYVELDWTTRVDSTCTWLGRASCLLHFFPWDTTELQFEHLSLTYIAAHDEAIAPLNTPQDDARTRGPGASQADGHRHHQYPKQPSSECNPLGRPPCCYTRTPQLRQRVPCLSRIRRSPRAYCRLDSRWGGRGHAQGGSGDVVDAVSPR